MGSQREIRGILWRGELVRALTTGDLGLISTAIELMGLERIADPVPDDDSATRKEKVIITTQTPTKLADASQYPQEIENISLWLITTYAPRQAVERQVDNRPAYLEWKVDPELQPPIPRLHTALNEVSPRLRRGLSGEIQSNTPDVHKLVRKIADRENVATIPRKRRRRWGRSVDVICDVSPRLAPILVDQTAIVERLSNHLRPDSFSIVKCSHPFGMTRSVENLDDGEDDYEFPMAGTQVLVIGDLGCLSGDERLQTFWWQWGCLARERGARLLALVPCGTDRVSQKLCETFSVQTWQHNRALIKDVEQRQELIELLFVLLAPAVRIEPGLLRDIRLILPTATDVSLEVDFWNSPLLASNHPVAATIDVKAANEYLRPKFENLSESLRQSALDCLRTWRLNLRDCPEIWLEEFLSLTHESQRLIKDYEKDLADSRAAVRKIVDMAMGSDTDPSRAMAFLYRSTERISNQALIDHEVGGQLRRMKKGLHDDIGTAGKSIGSNRAVPYDMQVDENTIRISGVNMEESTVRPASIKILSADGFFHFSLVAQQPLPANQFWKDGRKPDFVSAFGTDQYGAWFEFQVPRRDRAGMVTQLMRWIPLGSFLMGSPESESGRFEDEGPQNEVTLTHGFWLAETQCTQEMWEGIQVDNPSSHKGEMLPVHDVSIDAIQHFLSRLDSLVAGLSANLPTEAQWEYACRAHSTTEYHSGDGENALAKVGWYYGNSGGRPHEVAALQCNQFGLFDMHGNVWELCQDGRRQYTANSQVDPIGDLNGSSRVLRGGCWGYDARYVRSAYRRAFFPGHRHGYLGFRLLSSTSAEPTAEAAQPVAEQGSQPTRFGEAEEIFRPNPVIADHGKRVDVNCSGLRKFVVRSNLEEVQVQRLSKPEWAVEFGHDQFGTYADFEVEPESSTKETIVRQRLRWIPPGSFLMGSPDDEAGRFDDELQHEVIITSGYWMFDTPCTQQLWLAIMNENPSRFVDSRRPVEQVSWAEAVDFSGRLSARLPFRLVLPTEAQWEYACRAGTTTAIYTGNVEYLGDANAPLLDPIAWYGGNCGHEFDLSSEKGSEVTWVKDKQYSFKVGGTRRVKQKAPNPWGLYDMLGNVWEWCQDWRSEYEESSQTNPTGPESGLGCVIRGGSWDDDARHARSACRDRYDPGYRNSNLGFRLLSSATRKCSSKSPNEESASEAKPKDEAAQKQRTK